MKRSCWGQTGQTPLGCFRFMARGAGYLDLVGEIALMVLKAGRRCACYDGLLLGRDTESDYLAVWEEAFKAAQVRLTLPIG